MTILVLNAGSSSVKCALFDAALTPLLTASVTEIGGDAQLDLAGDASPVTAPDHADAIAALLAALTARGHGPQTLTAAAHRVVHGGASLTRTTRIDPTVMANIAAHVPLAPLHNPANLAGIEAMQQAAPGLPQFAGFDTAFHASNPAVATSYAISPDHGLRRWGFHGISYASLTAALPAIAGHLPARLLALHLGNGASLCAIRDGRSVATTMGYSPLSGLTMGTRCGDIDGNAVLRLAADHGIDGAARILNRESGLLALGGASDMRALAAKGASFAIDHFAYWAVRRAGSMIAAMGGLDAIAFTGGIGENDAQMRTRIMAGLAFTGLVPAADSDPDPGSDPGPAPDSATAPALHAAHSPVTAWIVPAAEERHIAAEALALLDAAGTSR